MKAILLVCGCNNHMLISPHILYTVAQIAMKNLKIKLNGNWLFYYWFPDASCAYFLTFKKFIEAFSKLTKNNIGS